jgi:predicted  nucleic acid-binding Zn-ribbon protein
MSTKLTGKGGNVAELSVLHHAPQSSNNSTAGAAGSAGSVLAEKETIIKTLRAQLEAANKAFATKDEESKRLASAVAAREQEIARSSRLISSTGAAASRVPTAADASGGSMLMSSNMADQYIAADIANKRIIDQLNGQVDFLNNELAKREAQLVEVNDKLLQYETVKVELAHRYADSAAAAAAVSTGWSYFRVVL